MAEVGVLQLTIQDNSESSAKGLDHLADALERVQKAVGNGLQGLQNIAGNLEKVAKAVNASITDSTISRLTRFSEALQGLKDVKLGELSKAMKSLNGVEERIRAASEEAGESNRGTNFTAELSTIDAYSVKLNAMKEKLREGISSGQWDSEKIADAVLKIQNLEDKIEKLKEMQSGGVLRTTNEDAIRAAESFLNASSNIDLLKQKLDAMKAEMGQGILSGTWDEKKLSSYALQVQNLEAKIQKLEEAAQAAQASMEGMTDGVADPGARFSDIETSLETSGQGASAAEAISEGLAGAGNAAESAAEGATELNSVLEEIANKRAQLAEMESEMDRLSEAMNTEFNSASFGDYLARAMELEDEISRLKQEIIELEQTMNSTSAPTVGGDVSDALSEAGQVATGAAGAITEGMADVGSAMENTVGAAGDASSGMRDVESSVEEAAEGSRTCTGSLKELDKELKQKKTDAESAASGLDTLKEGFRNLLGPLGNFLKGLTRIARYRMYRAILKQITSGIGEGVENVYHYSKAIGSSFAPAMDSAASALQQMRNSVGAALAPAIQSLIPYLEIVVSWFITLINYVNQFISLLRGQSTWTRAIPASAEAFTKTGKAAKGAGSAIKDLLADWDELNIIQSQGGGGGSGPTGDYAKDFLNMFEEVGQYEGWVKNLVDGIKEQFGDIWGLVKRVAAVILGWKVSSAFAGILGTLGALVAWGGVLDITFNLSEMFTGKYLKTGETGWLVADALTAIVGSFLSKKLITKVLGTGAGYAAVGITLSVSAIAGIKALIGDTDVSAFDTKSILAALTNAGKLGAGFYFFEKAAGISGLTAIAAAGEVASIAFGVILGIKAIVGAADTGEITKDTILDCLKAAGIAGAGVTFFKLIAGAGIASAVATGAITALTLGTAFAVALGIVAVLNMSKDTPLQWGERKLTDEQVKSYVLDGKEFFTVDVPVVLEMIDKTEEKRKQTKQEMEEDMINVLGTYNVIQLGIASKQDYDTMKGDVDKVIDTIHAYIQEAKQQEKLTLYLFPSLAENEEVKKNGWLQGNSSGWDVVDTWATKTGNRIGDLLVKAEAGTITKGETEVLNALINQMDAVTSGAARARINAGAESEFFYGIGSMGDLDEESFEKVVSMYAEYRKKLSEGYKQLAYERLATREELVSDLYNIDPNSKAYKQAEAYRNWLRENIFTVAEEEADKASRPGQQKIIEGIQSVWGDRMKEDAEHWKQTIASYVDRYGLVFDDDYVDSLMPDNPNASDTEKIANAASHWLREVLSYTDENLANILEQTGINPLAIMTDLWGETAESGNPLFDVLSAAYGPEKAAEVIRFMKASFAPVKGEAQQEQDELARTYTKVADAVDEAQESVGSGLSFFGEDGSHTETIQEELTYDVQQNVVYEEPQVEGQPATEPLGGFGGGGAVETSEFDELERAIQRVNGLKLNSLTFDTTGAQNSAGQAAWAVEDMAARIRAAFQSLDGIGFTFTSGSESVMARMHAFIPAIPAAASGALFKSGDIFSANENGKTELIGSYGNKTAVMNNDQVVGAVTNGVAQANSGVEDRLAAIENRLIEMIRKGLSAKVSPDSGWSRHAQASETQFGRVTG